MKDLLDQGAQVSREFLSKAGAKAQDLGERGVLALEIKQLEGQARKLLEQLGNQVYRILIEEGAESLSASEPAIKAILSDLSSIKGAVEKREGELETRRKSAP
jgi:ABC-type transporter Mla subunit MlaD